MGQWGEYLSGSGQAPPEVTRLLHRWRHNDDAAALAELLDLLYGVLRGMAEARLPAARDGDRTLRPTALVNEAMLRLMDGHADFSDRNHFLALAALKMRSVLADYARRAEAIKRGGDHVRVTVSLIDDDESSGVGTIQQDLFALDQALELLAAHDARAARVIECTYFGGMSREGTAQVLGVSVPTVDRDLRFARAWLNRQLAAPARASS